jgi:hypothetical protein
MQRQKTLLWIQFMNNLLVASTGAVATFEGPALQPGVIGLSRDFHFASRLRRCVSPFASNGNLFCIHFHPKPRACPARPLPGQKAMVCPIPQRFLGQT